MTNQTVQSQAIQNIKAKLQAELDSKATKAKAKTEGDTKRAFKVWDNWEQTFKG